MNLPPFALEHWLSKYEFRVSPVRYDLASSTGPRWTLAELQALPKGDLDVAGLALAYAPPEGSRALREAVAARHGVDPDWVVATTGASEAFSILLCLAAETGGNVVLPHPAFPAFAAMANAWRLAVREYALRREDGFQHGASLVLDALDERTVLALVNTPHNPTGAICPRSEIERIAADCRGRGIPLVVDEVYHPLYHGERQASAAGIDNVVVVGDLSKALSLPGLRIGWIVDADAERRKRIVNARSYFTVSGSPVNEAIAAHALLNAETLLARLASVASANLARLSDVIENAPDVLAWVRPQGGTVAYPWFVDGRNSRAFCEDLAEAGVLVVPGDCFGAPAHIRIGIGAQAEGFEAATIILQNAVHARTDGARDRF